MANFCSLDYIDLSLQFMLENEFVLTVHVTKEYFCQRYSRRLFNMNSTTNSTCTMGENIIKKYKFNLEHVLPGQIGVAKCA